MNAAKDALWNSVAGLADKDIIPDTLVTVGQETVFSKIIRKMLKRDNKSWMELAVFSLLTRQTDGGLGAWYGYRKNANEAGFSDVLMDAIRPVLSCVFCNYVLRVGEMGFHNPVKTFGFMDLLIMLASKDLAYGGRAILSQNSDTMAKYVLSGDEQFARQTMVSRLLSESTERKGTGERYVAKKKLQAEARDAE